MNSARPVHELLEIQEVSLRRKCTKLYVIVFWLREKNEQEHFTMRDASASPDRVRNVSTISLSL